VVGAGKKENPGFGSIHGTQPCHRPSQRPGLAVRGLFICVSDSEPSLTPPRRHISRPTNHGVLRRHVSLRQDTVSAVRLPGDKRYKTRRFRAIEPDVPPCPPVVIPNNAGTLLGTGGGPTDVSVDLSDLRRHRNVPVRAQCYGCPIQLVDRSRPLNRFSFPERANNGSNWRLEGRAAIGYY
jgi:hypothetical protein